jgi:2-polyprenyl-3-methyl-5-hydroxy-6-metoxy-1,4-benzoquinol methylase
MKYYFKKIEQCNMCGSSSHSHKTLGRRLNKSQGIRPSKKTGVTITVLNCSQCNLNYSSPLPIPLNIQDHYGIVPENYWTKEYFNSKLNIDKLIYKLQKNLNFDNKIKALDIGVGVGKMMQAMEDHGIESYGIEPSAQFYERAINELNISEDRLKCISIEDADFESAKFDFITFGSVLEHLYDPANSIEKALKWLKPGGIIYIQVPSSKWLIAKLLNLFYTLTGSNFCSNLSPMHTPFHLYEFDLKSFEQHAKRNNYTVADVEYVVCDTFLPKIFDRIVTPIMKATNTGMEIEVLLKKNQ